MPGMTLVSAPKKSRSALRAQVDAVMQTNQSPQDTWCVVAINDAHAMTIWSQPHDPEQVGVRPSNHAEELLAVHYADKFHEYLDMLRETGCKVEIFLKKSPCNYGAGSCYELFKVMLLKERLNSDPNSVTLVYATVYGGYNGIYSQSSYEALEDFEKNTNFYTQQLAGYNL
ncbi:hypothetical protein [Tengunoibacter tsumagoiensis]|uniref:Uncharacterized protein n=1 Tax=Tengunoibacter tsumagoiensis TaxID=2014871 RepID=A0A402A2V8_9CHLR|nr:hypothetical protein [Tengunoibacter tsumagoiensis]GCE13385.1 hypothetical protein KTT_32440 [Tengunoibacter tsumagoiensis]